MGISAKINLEFDENFLLDIDIDFPEGKIIALYGDSGSGKTTLLRCLAGLQPADAEIKSGDTIWQNSQGYLLPSHKRDIGFVFQDSRLFPHLTVEGNLRYAAKRTTKKPLLEKTQIIDQLGLSKLINFPVMQLSAGQQQRAAIARTLLSAPSWLFMDEPLSNLDYSSKQLILTFLERLQEQKKLNILYVSHDMEEISRIADHIVLLEKGRVVNQGPLIEISSRLDLKLSHQESAASVVKVVTDSFDPDYHITTVNLGDNYKLQLSQSLTDGAHRLRIPARDVSISLSIPQQSSILNCLPAVIDAIEPSEAARVLIRLQLGDQYILARLTHKSVDQLNLRVGQHVYAQIKSVALLSEAL